MNMIGKLILFRMFSWWILIMISKQPCCIFNVLYGVHVYSLECLSLYDKSPYIVELLTKSIEKMECLALIC